MIDRTDEETGELVRAWLQRYGISIIVGIVLAIALIGIYEWWQNRQIQVAQDISAQLIAIDEAVLVGDINKAESIYTEMRNDGKLKPLAALLLASTFSTHTNSSSQDEVINYLSQAMDSKDMLVSQTAKWQMAQMQIQNQDYSAAKQTLQSLKGSIYDRYIPLLQAVMAQQQDNNQAAIEHYRTLLSENLGDTAFFTAQINAVEGKLAVETTQ